MYSYLLSCLYLDSVIEHLVVDNDPNQFEYYDRARIAYFFTSSEFELKKSADFGNFTFVPFS